jgi:tetratricopeptide (TPR) repeat protein/tRNA A-37 threonylcarbamoyl transferase component Bud32
MNGAVLSDADRDHRLDEVLGAYLAALDEGRAPEPSGLLACHPHLADALSRFFADAERVTRLTAPLRGIAEAARGECVQRAAAGCRFGDYEVLEELGSGGMGIVYKARQRSLHRIVALKMIRAGHLSSASEKQRFRHEAAIVARLDHPSIVPVYEVGEWTGDGTAGQPMPYFCMKLFAGGSLADRLEQYAADPAGAARLVTEVARAVHHAHQRGVLHRDLKPSNVLLDESGRPHVADFGLAKRAAQEGEMGDASLTVTGALVGTPGYMAPEQALGSPLTTAADVYGLGAILYALLTGRPPFKGPSVLETLEQVRDREPEAPANLNPRIDRDMQAVCLKCLAKRPEQRYGSAEALAEDLERWLAGRPIQARPITASARLGRWCRRNPVTAGLSATAGVAVLAALVILGVSTGLVWWHSQQKDAALKAEKEQRERAEAKERLARRAVADYMRVVDEWLAAEPVMTETVRDFLDKALAFYEELAQEQGADPELRYRTAQAHHFVARIRTRLEQWQEAILHYQQQLALLKDLVAEFPQERKYRFDLFHCYLGLADVPGATTEAEHRAAHATIKELVRDFPDEPNYRDALAAATLHLAALHFGEEDFDEAERLAKEALDIAEQLVREYPDKRTVPHYPCNVATSLTRLGHIGMQTGRVAEAEDCYRRVVTIYDKLAADHVKEPEEPSYRHSAISARENLGRCLQSLDRFTDALETFEQCIPAAERLAREFPHGYTYRLWTGRLQMQRANCLVALGKRQEALEAFDAYVGLLDDLIREFPDKAELKWNLVDSLCRFPLAGPKAPARALELAEAASAASHSPHNLAMAYYRAGRWQDCIRMLEKESLALCRTNVFSFLVLAMAHWQNGDKERARKIYGETVAYLEKTKYADSSLRYTLLEAAKLIRPPK